jgi:aspartyl-tRNA(Asn)/glutamyl-tRNA(Gln) amidotransferase subunit C
MSRITLKEVEELAMLSRLQLEGDEAERMRGALEAVLSYIDQIQELDTTGVAPLTHAVGFACPLRPDEIEPSLPIEAVLQNAPRKDDRFFEVPRIVPKSDGRNEKTGGAR